LGRRLAPRWPGPSDHALAGTLIVTSVSALRQALWPPQEPLGASSQQLQSKEFEGPVIVWREAARLLREGKPT